jgi:branched-chain amino acid transport system substrate-binding protein
VATGDEPFSKRELDVVRLIVAGLSNQAIADQLGLSSRTVQVHVAKAMSKTRTQTRTQLAVYALRRELVSLEPEEDDRN